MIESAARRLAHELVNRREAINRELSRNGVRFGIYKKANTMTGCSRTTLCRALSNPTNTTNWRRA